MFIANGILYKMWLSFQVWKEAGEVNAYFLVRSHATSLRGKGPRELHYPRLYVLHMLQMLANI